MPEPAAKPTRWIARCFLTVKRPSGGITDRVWPAFTAVAAQFENTPSTTGRIPISISPSRWKRLRELLIE